jgi:hypothetical protein
MIELFRSLGATRFDVTWISAAGDEEKFRRDRMLVALSRNVPAVSTMPPETG